MTSATYFFVESEGIRLPDGSVFGAGTDLMYQITHGESYVDSFKIYQFINGQRLPISNPMRYNEMKAWVHDIAKHYTDHGMKLWEASGSEWSKASYKKLVDENY